MPWEEVFAPSYICCGGPGVSVHAGTSGHGTQEPVYRDQVCVTIKLIHQNQWFLQESMSEGFLETLEWWSYHHVSDSVQYDNSCPVMFVFSVRHVETRRAFPHIFDIAYEIKVLVSVSLKNTSKTLLTYCYLWKPCFCHKDEKIK